MIETVAEEKPRDPIAEAKKAIASILQDLEIETGSIVETLGLVRFDATRINSERTEHVVEVELVLARLPGHEWQT